VIVFAANPLQPLINAFEWILLKFHDDIGFGWGLSIIAMTVLVRAALLPLTFKQFKSMQSLASHAPEMKKLQERYKGDKERLNQEMMKFYRENKINPFASCLPLLAQLPVFLSLFYMLRKDLRVDICPEVQPPTLLMSTTTDKTQRMIFLALPFVFVVFIISFPAGLLVYWITTNLWTIVQQTIIRRRLGPMRPPGSEPGMGLGELLRGGATGGAGGGGARATGTPAAATAGGDSNPPKGKPSGPPPAPPRRKKKRSGRRR
jgi:YidC/Oxa1 family membrane protein insertase